MNYKKKFDKIYSIWWYYRTGGAIPIILPLMALIIDYFMILPCQPTWPLYKQCSNFLVFIRDSVLTFDDPASVYSYHLITFHNKTMVSILIILILVYWCLYKIIKDFKILRFYRGDFLVKNPAFAQHMHTGLIELVDWSDFIWVELYDVLIFGPLRRLRGRLNRPVFVYELGCRGRGRGFIMRSFYLLRYILLWLPDKIFTRYYGSQRDPIYYLIEYKNALSFNGQSLFHHEINSFNTKGWWRRLHSKEPIPANNHGNYKKQFIHNKGHLHFNKHHNNGGGHSHYLTQYLFFNGRIDKRSYTRRCARSYASTSLYGIMEAISVYKNRRVAIIRRVAVMNNRLRNPNKYITQDIFFESQDFKHCGWFEFVWAVYPSSIIFTILVPSLYLLYSLDDQLDPHLTVKVIGHQWYWSYEFDNWIEVSRDVFDFVSYKYNSNIMSIDDLELGTKRLLEVDKRLVLPINLNIRFVITSSDVLHSWAVPSLGIKSDAVPGRLNQFIAYITYPGVYYGQCSELCGAAHGFMPIVVQGVPYQVFVTWLKESNFC